MEYLQQKAQIRTPTFHLVKQRRFFSYTGIYSPRLLLSDPCTFQARVDSWAGINAAKK